MRILFVVDNAQWVRAVEELAPQFEVQVVHLGRKVPASIRDWNPDVLVLDVKLPHLNGITVAELVREDWPHLPIVFACEDYDTGDRRLPVMCAFLAKPYSAATLAHLITRAAAYKAGSF